MVKVEPQLAGKQDPRLEFLLKQVKDAISIFTDAIQKSSDNQESIGFKAFTLKTTKEESSVVFNIIMVAVAMELKEQAEDLIQKYTFYHTEEHPSDDEHVLMLFCRKVAPPTKEEIDKKMKEEIESNTVIDDDRTVAEVISASAEVIKADKADKAEEVSDSLYILQG